MNRTSRTGAARGVVGVVVFVVLAFSLFYCSLKRDLLGYHTRDFVFYAQFAAKGFDRSLGADLTLNPEGNNLFGMHGFEGEGGLHRSVHFEPVKYLYAAAYRLTGSLLVLFLITGLILLLPAAYVAVHHRRDGPGDVGFAALAACLYALWPSMVPAIAYDLRPFALLAPLYAMAVLSIQYRRPLAERLLWFNLMFLAREEALVLGIFVWAFALRMERDGDRGRVNLGYGITWAAWAAATAAFYWWMRLDFAFENSPLTLAARLSVADLAVLAAVVLVVAALAVWAYRRAPGIRPAAKDLAPLALALVPLACQQAAFLQSDKDPITWIKVFLFHGQFAVYFVALWVLVPVLWEHLTGKRARRIFAGALVLLLVLSAAADGIYIGRVVPQFKVMAEAARPVRALREAADARETVVLCDYATLQAFFDFRHAYAYNRLPASLVPGMDRYYPENLEHLAALIDARVEFIAVSAASRVEVRRIAGAMGWGVTELTREDDAFLLYRVNRQGRRFEGFRPEGVFGPGAL